MLDWLEDLRIRLPSLPGFGGVPARLLRKLLPKGDIPPVEFEGTDIILALYAGHKDTSTRNAMERLDEPTARKFMEMDTCRAEPHMDVLDDCAYLGVLDLSRTGWKTCASDCRACQGSAVCLLDFFKNCSPRATSRRWSSRAQILS